MILVPCKPAGERVYLNSNFAGIEILSAWASPGGFSSGKVPRVTETFRLYWCYQSDGDRSNGYANLASERYPSKRAQVSLGKQAGQELLALWPQRSPF